MAETACIIGKGIQIRGNMSGSGDLIIEGRVEGHISLQDHLTVEDSGTVVADIETHELTVNGKLLYSKLKLGRHAAPGEAVGLVKTFLEEGK